jgi:predicted RNase H-like HicB family nuclease
MSEKKKEYTRGLKDDTALFEWTDETVERQRAAGVPDAEIFRLTALKERIARSRAYDAALKKRWRYHIIIASQDGRFRAHAPTFPDIIVEADSVEAARKALACVLSHRLRDLFFAGKSIPEEQTILETLEVSLKVEPSQP